MRRWVAGVVATLIVVLPISPTAEAVDHCEFGDTDCAGAPTTAGDQDAGAIVTSGSLFPNGSAGDALGDLAGVDADCPDCQWSVVPSCQSNGPGDGTGPLCTGAVSACPDPGDVRYRVYLRRGDGPWEYRGTICLGPKERGPTVAELGAAVRVEVVKYLPDADPSFQPASGGIVNLPTIFAAGEPEAITTRPFDVLGFSVVVTATARWEWQFAPGVVSEFAVPGGAYPDTSVSYTYDDVGSRAVTVTTYWSGRFTADGHGPYAVPGPEISKTAGPIPVPVRQARSELVGG